ncbi:MAG: flagellar basal body-associated FliL family protein [Desulfovibrio sp.]|nr:flagellar basal body-associated FliL family protein [Desulfovibrio sp.]
MAKEKKKAAALPEGDENTPAPKKKSKKTIIIIILVLLFMLGGMAGGGYWWFFIRNPGMISALTDGEADPQKQTETEHVETKDQPAQASVDQNSGVDPKARLDKPAPLPRSTGVVLPLPMVTVNLYENGGHRYLKLGMEVEASRDISGAIKANEARIRDAVIMLLAGKTYAEIASPDGKVMLKAEVANRLNQIIGEQRIIRVYFTDFVVQ